MYVALNLVKEARENIDAEDFEENKVLANMWHTTLEYFFDIAMSVASELGEVMTKYTTNKFKASNISREGRQQGEASGATGNPELTWPQER